MRKNGEYLFAIVILCFVIVECDSSRIFKADRRLLSLADLMGLGKYYESTITVIKTNKTDSSNSTFSLLVDPKTYANLTNFVTKTAYCLKKCSVTSVVCIVFYGCTGQLVKFFLMVLIPIFIVILIVICCTWRYWTCKCWLKYMFICTGVGCIIWLVSKCCCGKRKKK